MGQPQDDPWLPFRMWAAKVQLAAIEDPTSPRHEECKARLERLRKEAETRDREGCD